MHKKSSAKLGEVKERRGEERTGEAAKYAGQVAQGRPAQATASGSWYKAMADPMLSATRTVWRALLVRPLLQLGRNHQMAVVTGGVTSRVGDVPGDSGTTWTRS